MKSIVKFLLESRGQRVRDRKNNRPISREQLNQQAKERTKTKTAQLKTVKAAIDYCEKTNQQLDECEKYWPKFQELVKTIGADISLDINVENDYFTGWGFNTPDDDCLGITDFKSQGTPYLSITDESGSDIDFDDIKQWVTDNEFTFDELYWAVQNEGQFGPEITNIPEANRSFYVINIRNVSKDVYDMLQKGFEHMGTIKNILYGADSNKELYTIRLALNNSDSKSIDVKTFYNQLSKMLKNY